MAQAKKITVWNAAQHVLKVGHSKLVLQPGYSLSVERDSHTDDLLQSGKLVIVEDVVEVALAVEETPKKKKKEVPETAVEASAEESAENDVTTEVAEDSILPEEVN